MRRQIHYSQFDVLSLESKGSHNISKTFSLITDSKHGWQQLVTVLHDASYDNFSKMSANNCLYRALFFYLHFCFHIYTSSKKTAVFGNKVDVVVIVEDYEGRHHYRLKLSQTFLKFQYITTIEYPIPPGLPV